MTEDNLSGAKVGGGGVVVVVGVACAALDVADALDDGCAEFDDEQPASVTAATATTALMAAKPLNRRDVSNTVTPLLTG